jgi:hypoxanthine phosphoribosyltransferase
MPRRPRPEPSDDAPGPEFAHPVEREYARLLDEHGIAWEYEPRTFVLERNPDGTIHEAFTPDFYLPDQDLFIETTVMRQRLTSRKNRKVRKLRDRHGVLVAVLYRRDLIRLARRWGLAALERAVGPGTRPVRFGTMPTEVPEACSSSDTQSSASSPTLMTFESGQTSGLTRSTPTQAPRAPRARRSG